MIILFNWIGYLLPEKMEIKNMKLKECEYFVDKSS